MQQQPNFSSWRSKRDSFIQLYKFRLNQYYYTFVESIQIYCGAEALLYAVHALYFVMMLLLKSLRLWILNYFLKAVSAIEFLFAIILSYKSILSHVQILHINKKMAKMNFSRLMIHTQPVMILKYMYCGTFTYNQASSAYCNSWANKELNI